MACLFAKRMAQQLTSSAISKQMVLCYLACFWRCGERSYKFQIMPPSFTSLRETYAHLHWNDVVQFFPFQIRKLRSQYRIQGLESRSLRCRCFILWNLPTKLGSAWGKSLGRNDLMCYHLFWKAQKTLPLEQSCLPPETTSFCSFLLVHSHRSKIFFFFSLQSQFIIAWLLGALFPFINSGFYKEESQNLTKRWP